MKYTIRQVSELVNLSKASIYNKLKSMDLEKHTTKKQGVTYLDSIGLKMIQDTLKDFEEDDIKAFKEPIKNSKYVETNNDLNDETATDVEDSSIKIDYINYLKEQLKERDVQFNKQLAAKDEQIKELHRLLENDQVLLKNKPQDMKLLEEHFQDLDEKFINIKEQMASRIVTPSFFNKLFNKK